MVPQICRCLTLQAEPDVRRLLELQRRRTARCQRLGRRHTPAQGLPAQRETLLLRYVARHRIHDDQVSQVMSSTRAPALAARRCHTRSDLHHTRSGTTPLRTGGAAPHHTAATPLLCNAAVKRPSSVSGRDDTLLVLGVFTTQQRAPSPSTAT